MTDAIIHDFKIITLDTMHKFDFLNFNNSLNIFLQKYHWMSINKTVFVCTVTIKDLSNVPLFNKVFSLKDVERAYLLYDTIRQLIVYNKLICHNPFMNIHNFLNIINDKDNLQFQSLFNKEVSLSELYFFTKFV